jgi:hypothetical protein
MLLSPVSFERPCQAMSPQRFASDAGLDTADSVVATGKSTGCSIDCMVYQCLLLAAPEQDILHPQSRLTIRL